MAKNTIRENIKRVRENIKRELRIFAVAVIGVFLLANVANAIVYYAPSASLRPGDITTSHILNGTILREDINQSNAFYFNTSTTTGFGIGTTTPWGKLSVHAQYNTNNSAAPLFVVASSTQSATSTFMTVLANGNVGIGTTSPSQKLEVAGGNVLLDNAMAYQIRDDLGTARNVLYTSNTGVVSFLGYHGVGVISSGSGATYFYPSAGSIIIAALGASGLTINSAGATIPAAGVGLVVGTGNVGIGTTSPYTKLGVVGEIVAANFTATTTATSTFAGALKTTGTGIEFSDGTIQKTSTPINIPTILLQDNTSYVTSGSVGTTTVFSYTLPAGTMGIDSTLEIYGLCYRASGTGTIYPGCSVQFGNGTATTTIGYWDGYAIDVYSPPAHNDLRIKIVNRHSQSSQFETSFVTLLGNSGISASIPTSQMYATSTTYDTSGKLFISFRGRSENAGGSGTFGFQGITITKY